MAAAAGVSQATVSRVLTGSARVTTQVRQRVHAALGSLGYQRRQRLAGTTSSGAPAAVALLIGRSTSRMFADPYFARLVAGVEQALSREGISLVLTSSCSDALHSTERFLAGRHADALLVASLHKEDPLATVVAGAGVPLRWIGRPPGRASGRYVDVDNAGGARQAVEYLAHQGRRVITNIAGPPGVSAADGRLTGYRSALASAGLPVPPVAHGDFTQGSGAHAMNWLLDRQPRLDAVFVASDLMAVGALHALRRAGRRVPDDVAVIGFDDAAVARMATPALSTVRQPIETLGRLAAELLLTDLSTPGEPSGDAVLPIELVLRESA
ncbi:LacI family DNA-binding transcriptional regulator [Micromonospora mangrovi]|uniref:LacI family DNA-binding transcriptional regulator n=2 Tax=Micromonospora TaxID=1873 RepID=A0AAU8HD14_9ACTN